LNKSFFVAVLVFVGLSVFFMRIGDSAEIECSKATHIVSQGETMWRIAEEHCTGNVQRVVDELIELNGGTTRVYPTQLIVLP
jgi:hypothetical protein